MADVEDFCEEHNITLEIKYTVSDTSMAGTILKQSREAGSTVSSGAKFTITVAENEEPVENESSDEEICTDEDRELGNC